MVWSIKDLVPTCIFAGEHNDEVYLLRFLGDENYLVSACKRLTPGVLIHDISTKQLVFACCLDEFIRGINTIEYLVAEIIEERKFSNNRMNFFFFSQHSIYFFYHKNSDRKYSILKHDKMENNFGETLGDITSLKTLLLATSGSHLKCLAAGWEVTILSGHADGKVCIWTVDQSHTSIKPSRILCFYSSPITAMVITSLGFTICTEDLSVHIWDLDFATNIKEMDLNSLGMKINSKLKNVVPNDDEFFFITIDSEMFSFELKVSQMWSKNMFVHKYQVNAINSVFALGDEMTCTRFVERVAEVNKGRRKAGHRGWPLLESLHDQPDRPQAYGQVVPGRRHHLSRLPQFP